MKSTAKPLLVVVLFASVLLLGAATSPAGGHRSLKTLGSGGGPVPHLASTCQISTSNVFDTNWNEDYSTSPPSISSSVLGISSLKTPFTDIPLGQSTDSGAWSNLDASTYYASGDYYGLVSLGNNTYQLELYSSDGSAKQLIDSTGTVLAIGDGYIFFLGNYLPPYGNGTLLNTLPTRSLSLGGSTSPQVDVQFPSETQVSEALACPTITSVVPGDTQAALSWTMPADASIQGYSVDVTDQTNPGNDTYLPFPLTADPNLTSSGGTETATITGLANGDTYTFDVAANFNWGADTPAGTASLPSSPVVPIATPSTPSITNIPSAAVVGDSFDATVTTNSTGVVSVTSSTASVCTVSGFTVDYIGMGTCTLQAAVAATSTYSAATGSDQSFNVAAAQATTTTTTTTTSTTTTTTTTTTSTTTTSTTTTSTTTTSTTTTSTTTTTLAPITPSTPTITNLPTAGVVGGSFEATVTTNSDGTKSVQSLSSSVCSVSGFTVVYVGVGTCTLQARVASTSSYRAATGTNQSFNVNVVQSVVTTTSSTTTTSTTTTSTTTTTLAAQPAVATTTTTMANPPSTTIISSPPSSLGATTTTTQPTLPNETTTTQGATGQASAATTTTTTTLPNSTNANIAFCGQPGVSIVNCQLTIQGQGLEPNTDVTVDVHSTPTQVGTTSVQADGSFNVAGVLPSNLEIGVHHVIVTGTSTNGGPYTQDEVFTVIAGKRIGSIGWVPPAPLAGDIQFVPTSHRTVILAATAGVTAAAAAVASGLGGGLAFGGGGPAPTGGGSGGSRGPAGAALEGVELERLEGESRDDGPGDRSRFWRWPGTGFLDRWSRSLPRRVARVSPVAGRVMIDGDYLRAMLGSVWIGLCLASIGLGAYASASSGWYAVPPSLGLFLAILALGVLDSLLGFLAGAAFLLCSAFAGHLSSAPELRLSMGLVLVWFAVPLAASALRPLRRTVALRFDAVWERAADLVVCGLFAAWVADKMTSALSGLSGVELPINHHVGTIVIAVLAFVAFRIVVETTVAHFFPGRLAAVRHEGRLNSGRLQKFASLIAQIVIFIFIAVAILGASWALFVGTAIFFTPLVLELFEHRMPKSRAVARWKPNVILTWTLIICVGVLLGELLKHTIHQGRLVEQIGFILLPVPVLAFWMLELFEEHEEDEEEEQREAASSDGESSTAKRSDEVNEVLEFSPAVKAPSSRRGGARSSVAASSPVAVLERPEGRVRPRSEQDSDEAGPQGEPNAAVTGLSERILTLRKWMARMAGVTLIIISVLLVHFQGGG